MSEPIAELDILWITAGLSCDGDTIAVTAATQPSIEDILLGIIPGIPRVELHNPVLAYRNGKDFLEPFRQAAAGRLGRPYILVVEGSIPNEGNKTEGALFKLTDQVLVALKAKNVPESVLVKLYPLKNKECPRDDFIGEMNKLLNANETREFQSIILNHAVEGLWAGLGIDEVTGQPIPTTDWIDRLAPQAWAVVAAGTCAAYGGIHAMSGNPTGCMGLADYLGWDFRSAGRLPIVNVPGCPVQPDNFMEVLLYLLRQAAGVNAWFKFTDHVLTALRNAQVPEAVLVKLNPLKDRGLFRDDMQKEIAKVLTPDETKLFRSIMLNHARVDPNIPLDDKLRPVWLFGSTVHEGCDRGGFYEQAEFAKEYGDAECIVKLGCWGPVVNCNVGKRGWLGGVGGCANVGGICIGCTMPGFPDKFMPFMTIPAGALLSSTAVLTYGTAVRALRKFTQASMNQEPEWRKRGTAFEAS